MNIVVVRTDGSWYTRPDISLVRDADRFCLPDDCTAAVIYRAVCIRIEKAGKAIGECFAGRYFNSCAKAFILYGVLADGSHTPYLDRATIVERQFRPVEGMEKGTRAGITKKIVEISRHISYRTGDFIVFEQGSPVMADRGSHFENIDIL